MSKHRNELEREFHRRFIRHSKVTRDKKTGRIKDFDFDFDHDFDHNFNFDFDHDIKHKSGLEKRLKHKLDKKHKK
jgi:hypothetical protein